MLRQFSVLVWSHSQNSSCFRIPVRHLFRKWPSPFANQSFCLCTTNKAEESSLKMAKPQLIVFDLDYTLWPFWVDTHVRPPFKMASNGKVHDADGQHVEFYRDVPSILESLRREGYQLGVASRTGAISDARDLLRLFNWEQYFHYTQIYPGCKVTHFKKIQEQSGINFKDMMFFDDEQRNIVDVSKLGVSCALCPDGLSHDVLEKGFENFRRCYS